MSDVNPEIRRARIKLVLLLALIAGLALVVMAALRLRALAPPSFHGTAYEDQVPAPPFALTTHEGRRVSLADFRGRPVLLFFGFTHCPDFCPLTLSRLTRIRKELGGSAADTEILLVTMDPARDTPAALDEYVRRFGGGERITGLTGDSASLAAAYAGYGAYVLPQAAPAPISSSSAPDSASAGNAGGAHGAHQAHGAHEVDGGAKYDAGTHAGMPHSSVVYGIDRSGRLRVIISEGSTEEATRDDVRTLARL